MSNRVLLATLGAVLLAVFAPGCGTTARPISSGSGGNVPQWTWAVETSMVDGGCFPRELTPKLDGQVACAILEGRHVPSPMDCCAGQPGRGPVPAEHAALLAHASTDPIAQAEDLNCFCELDQLGGAPSPGCSSIASGLAACQCDVSATPELAGQPVDGWCYVDADATPLLSNPAIVGNCPDTQKRLLRFVGGGNPLNGATTFLACAEL